MAQDEFDQKSQDFLDWLTAQNASISDKVKLVDFRKHGAGRGLGMEDDALPDSA